MQKIRRIVLDDFSLKNHQSDGNIAKNPWNKGRNSRFSDIFSRGPWKKGGNKRSSDVFSRGSNRRSIRRRTVSAKENYTEIKKTGPPNQRPETLTGQKSPIRNLQRWKRGDRSATDQNTVSNS